MIMSKQHFIDIGEIANASILTTDGTRYKGRLLLVPEGSWDEDDIPQFNMITKEGILEDNLEEIVEIVDLSK